MYDFGVLPRARPTAIAVPLVNSIIETDFSRLRNFGRVGEDASSGRSFHARAVAALKANRGSTEVWRDQAYQV